MQSFEADGWLALWEPTLLGQPAVAAAAQVTAAGLIPRLTYYVSDASEADRNVVVLLVGDNGKIRMVSRG